MWLRMSNWGRVNKVLEPRERSLVYNVGKRLREDNLYTGPMKLDHDFRLKVV
jgi:hypothetical protein